MKKFWNALIEFLKKVLKQVAASQPPISVITNPLPQVIKTCPATVGEYEAKYKAAQIRPENLVLVKNRAEYLAKFRVTFYQPIADAVGCPWWVPALIHNQECGSDVGLFKACLHNGERIIGTSKKTTIVPIGKGPFTSFVEAGIDALKSDKNFSSVTDIGSALLAFEKYNGLGYRNHNVSTPYLWAMTDQYIKGHYVGDHNFDPNAVSKNFGIVSVMKCLGL